MGVSVNCDKPQRIISSCRSSERCATTMAKKANEPEIYRFVFFSRSFFFSLPKTPNIPRTLQIRHAFVFDAVRCCIRARSQSSGHQAKQKNSNNNLHFFFF
jgi:hypothetical protein